MTKPNTKFKIGCFTKSGAARLAKTYRAMGYVPVAEMYDEKLEMHFVTYDEVPEKKVVYTVPRRVY